MRLCAIYAVGKASCRSFSEVETNFARQEQVLMLLWASFFTQTTTSSDLGWTTSVSIQHVKQCFRNWISIACFGFHFESNGRSFKRRKAESLGNFHLLMQELGIFFLSRQRLMKGFTQLVSVLSINWFPKKQKNFEKFRNSINYPPKVFLRLIASWRFSNDVEMKSSVFWSQKFMKTFFSNSIPSSQKSIFQKASES